MSFEDKRRPTPLRQRIVDIAMQKTTKDGVIKMSEFKSFNNQNIVMKVLSQMGFTEPLKTSKGYHWTYLMLDGGNSGREVLPQRAEIALSVRH